MSWLVAGGFSWLLAVGFFCLLARSAGMADTGPEEVPVLAGVGDVELSDGRFAEAFAPAVDRREGPAERRAQSRPWSDGAPARRREDLARQAEEAERRLRRSKERFARYRSDTA